MSRPTYFAAVASVFFFFFSPPLYSQRSQTGCLPYFHTWCSLSPNLEFMSEMCCTRRAENTVRKNLRRKIGICAPSPKFVGYIFAIRASIDNRKVNLLNNNPPYVYTGNFGPSAAEIDWPVLGTPANFNGFRVLASLSPWQTARHDELDTFSCVLRFFCDCAFA